MACLHRKNNLGLASVADITRQGAETRAWERKKKQALSFFSACFQKSSNQNTQPHFRCVSWETTSLKILLFLLELNVIRDDSQHLNSTHSLQVFPGYLLTQAKVGTRLNFHRSFAQLTKHHFHTVKPHLETLGCSRGPRGLPQTLGFSNVMFLLRSGLQSSQQHQAELCFACVRGTVSIFRRALSGGIKKKKKALTLYLRLVYTISKRSCYACA